MLYTPGVFSPRSSFTGRRKLAIFLGGRPTDLMLCLDSIRHSLLVGRVMVRVGMEIEVGVCGFEVE